MNTSKKRKIILPHRVYCFCFFFFFLSHCFFLFHKKEKIADDNIQNALFSEILASNGKELMVISTRTKTTRQRKHPEQQPEQHIFTILFSYLIDDCIWIILDYAQILTVPYLVQLVNKKMKWTQSFSSIISEKEWRKNLILYKLIFSIERKQPFRTERILCVLVDRERKKLLEEKKEQKEKCVSSSASLLDLIIFLNLFSECEWWTDIDEDKKTTRTTTTRNEVKS